MTDRQTEAEWKSTACNLCFTNCGIKVQIGGEGNRHIVRIRGDKSHPASRGYTCQKALQIDYYQNGRDRLTSPLRRRDDGSFEEIDWDTAISEVATKMKAIRDEHGGDKIFKYSGGSQGSHLGGAFFGPVSAALGMQYGSNPLAQEKTGIAWNVARMYGANVHGEMHEADVVLFVGKNPWHSNGIQRARILVRNLSKDPNKTLIVIDPRRSETAEFADIHLAVKPGRDAWCLTAMIACVIQEDLLPHDWLTEHTNGLGAVLKRFENINVEDYAAFAGLDAALLRKAARAIGEADKAAYYEDLGVQMSPHSTLLSYLNLLLVTLTGHFGKRGTSAILSHLVAPLFNIGGVIDSDEAGYEAPGPRSPVVGARIVGGTVPCNAIPDEILTDHPNRYRAMWIEAGNPAHSMADSHKWREALRALDLVVVMDVAMTETAREADYVLPGPSQYEKWEATFFNFEYPRNVHHLRAPLFEPRGNTLPEPEIHARMFEALDVLDPDILKPLKEAAAKGLDTYGEKAFEMMGTHPEVSAFLPYVLYRTLGPTLKDGAAAAAFYWPIAQRYAAANADAVHRAGFEGEGLALGNALFEGILNGRSGVVFGEEVIEASFDKIAFADKKIRLNMAEMLDEVDDLSNFEDLIELGAEFPLILNAGERRAYNANTAIRDPAWMKSNDATTMSVHPQDAAGAGITDGGRARVVTEAGSAEVTVILDERMKPGTMSLPNGLGLLYPDDKGEDKIVGVPVNELTSLIYQDKFVGTPFHKFVPARLEAV